VFDQMSFSFLARDAFMERIVALLPVRPFVCLSVCLSVRPSICLYVCMGRAYIVIIRLAL